MPFLNRFTHARDHIVLDIGSSSVNGARVGFDGQGRLEVKKIFRSSTLILPEVNLKKLWRHIGNFAKETIHGLAEETKVSANEFRLEEALVVFSSPWYFSEINHFSLTQKELFKVDQDFLRRFLSEAGEKFKQASLKRLRVDEDEIKILDADIMRVKLNGYPVRQIIGKYTHTLEAFMGLTAVFKQAADDIQVMMQEVGCNDIRFQASPQVFYKTLGRLSNRSEFEQGLVVIDIGGEVTDVFLLRSGLLVGSASYARGLNYSARRLADVFNLELNESLTLLENYESKKLEASKVLRVKKALTSALTEWRDFLESTLAQLAQKELLPQKLLLLGQGALLGEFKEILASKDFQNYTLFGRPFSVSSSLPDDLKARFSHFPSSFLQSPLLPLSFYVSYV